MDNLNTEEEAKAYFEEKIKAEWESMKTKKPSKEIDTRELRDPYYNMLKKDKPIESRYSNYYDIEDEAWEKYYNKADQNIARYPVGFRHYENWENYRVVNPHASVEDYHQDSTAIFITDYLYSEPIGRV